MTFQSALKLESLLHACTSALDTRGLAPGSGLKKLKLVNKECCVHSLEAITGFSLMINGSRTTLPAQKFLDHVKLSCLRVSASIGKTSECDHLDTETTTPVIL